MAIVGRVNIKDFDALMAKYYRKKPITITAIQMNAPFEVQTAHGVVFGEEGDFVIKGIDGELYPCQKNKFKTLYEEVK